MAKNIIEIIKEIKNNKENIQNIKDYINKKTKAHQIDMANQNETLKNLQSQTKALEEQSFSVNLGDLVEEIARRNNLNPNDINAEIVFSQPLFNVPYTDHDSLLKHFCKNSYKIDMAFVVENKNTHENLATFRNQINHSALQQDGKPFSEHLRFRTINFFGSTNTSEIICDDYSKLLFEYPAAQLNPNSFTLMEGGPNAEEALYIIDAINLENTREKL